MLTRLVAITEYSRIIHTTPCTPVVASGFDRFDPVMLTCPCGCPSGIDYKDVVHPVGEQVFVGTTVATDVDWNTRLMSDVWGDVRYAIVFVGQAEILALLTNDASDAAVKVAHDTQLVTPMFMRVHVSSEGFDPQYDVSIDAPPGVIRLYEHARAHRKLELTKSAADYQKAQDDKRAEIERKRPDRGRLVRVVKGRKVPKGTEGVCIWIGMTQYGQRVGLKDAAGTVHWTAATNVEAVADSTPPMKYEGRYAR
jgi:hypothetical protein